jgi:DNA-binding XRE family transcriptional regulator
VPDLLQLVGREVDIHRDRARPISEDARRGRDRAGKLVEFFQCPTISRDIHRQDVIRAGHRGCDRDLTRASMPGHDSTYMDWRQWLRMTRLRHVPEPLDAFTANLRRARAERGLSQEAVGDRAGMTQSQYGRIERGEVDPSIKTLARLGTALGVTPSDLLRGV